MSGRLRPPPSKSLTQRYYDLALLAGGTTTIERPLRSDDCDHFLAGLEAVGCRVDEVDAGVTVRPPLAPGRGVVNCGASGTMARLMAASLCALPGRWRLDGTARLRERPMAPLLEALSSLGAGVRCLDRDGFLPLDIEGGSLVGGSVRLASQQSSQFLSALLIAGAASPRGVRVEASNLVSRPYVELSRRALGDFGVEVEERDGDRYSVPAGRPRGGLRVTVEADASAACYLAAAVAICGGEVSIEGVGRDSAQGDVRFIDLLGSMGVHVDWHDRGVRVSGGGALEAIEADLAAMPDQVPTLAAVAPFARGRTVISNVGHLRLKESDRLAAMARELGRLGVPAEELGDGLRVEGCWAATPPPGSAVVVDSHDDHRIAMSCALVGLRRPGVRVARPEVVGKSYPAFWRDLERLTR